MLEIIGRFISSALEHLLILWRMAYNDAKFKQETNIVADYYIVQEIAPSSHLGENGVRRVSFYACELSTRNSKFLER